MELSSLRPLIDTYIAPNLSHVTGLVVFLSQSYGTGNTGLDVCIACGSVVTAIFVISLMKLMGIGGSSSSREEELLEDVSEALHDLQVRAYELRSQIAQEFERCKGELGYIRFEVQKMRESRSVAVLDHSVHNRRDSSGSLRELFTNS